MGHVNGRKGRLSRAESVPTSKHGYPGEGLRTHERRSTAKQPIVVMKFGGTSLGDASGMERALEIIQSNSEGHRVVAVVSAMSRVTDQLIEFARRWAAGDSKGGKAVLENVRKRHAEAVRGLIPSMAKRRSLGRQIRECLREGERFFESRSVPCELTPRAIDLISSLGERLTARIVAAALMERGIGSEAIEATEVLITNSEHGNADPDMEMTAQRCESRLRPLLDRGVIPVITGFLGATPDGAVTTLGRGGSDYSATIIGAALGAEGIILWTDVDGVLTADPRWVPDPCPIPEISYRQAATLAIFGAKVLHPKTLRPVLRHKIPIWIRNTFAAHLPGTQIVPEEHRNGGSAKALAVIPDAALIGVHSSANGMTPEKIKRARTALAGTGADVLFHSQTSSAGDFCLAVRSAQPEEAIAALRRAFRADPCIAAALPVSLSKGISVLTVVGDAGGESGTLAKEAVEVMRGENVRVLASALDKENCSFSIALARTDLENALVALHRASLGKTAASERV